MKKIFHYYEPKQLSSNWTKLLLTMRIIAFLLFIGVLDLYSIPSYSQNTKISLDMKNASIEDVLSKIEDSSEFYFLFNQKLIDVNRRVDIKANKKPISEILSDMFDDDVNFIVYDRQIILTPADESGKIPEFQQLKIKGKVTDATTGEPLPGVNVRIEGTNIGAITDINGSYSLEVSKPDAVIQFSFIGFISENIIVAGKQQIDVSLKADVSALGEVIVVGYGTQSKRSVTGSIQSLNTEELSDMPVTTMAQKLQGKLAGVQINQTTGKPGQGMQIRIRGQASLTAGNDPLYVVDGFPITGDISGINPNEIESISVLKDASSAAMYGSRAANGVIMVTTKRAKAGKTSVGLTAYYGWQSVPEKGRPEMMNGTEFAQFKKESYEDRGVPVPEQFQNPEEYGEGYNYYDALLRVAPIQDYSLSLSSAKDNFSTSAVLGYFDQDGVVINSNYKRYSLRLNSEYKISKKITAGVNAAPTYSINNSPNTDGQFWASGLVNNSLLTWPIFPYENPDGTLPMMSWDPEVSAFPTPNYYRAAQEIINETKNTRLLANAFIIYEPLAGLVLKSTLNYDLGNTKYDNIVPSTTSAGFATVLPTTSNAIFRTSQYGSWLNENTITYTKSLNDHNFELLGGFTIQDYRSEIQQIAVTGFPDDRVPTVGASANINRSGTTNTYNDIQEWSLMSYLARLNYNYKNKYLLSVVARTDGSSRFGSDKRWGTFPSLSAGWIVSEENFMKDVSKISLLKLRASYGVVGNNNIGNYTQYATVSSGSSGYNAIFGSSLASGSAVTSMPNTLLTWEQSQEMDLGFDLGLFKNRLNVGYDYYNRRTKSLLYSVNVAQESGFTSFIGNIGELQFWGHEFTISSQNLVGRFKWNTDFNIAFTDNRVNELTGLIDRIYGDGTITKVGQKIGLFYGMIHDGVYVDQADYDNSPKATLSEVGTAKFRDVGGGTDGITDGRITNGGDNDDRTVIGDPTPKFIFGMTNNFSYKSLDLSVVISGSYGNDIANMSEQGLTNLDGVFNVLSEIQNRWRSPSSPGAGKYGKTTSGTSYERDWFNSRFVSDASYLSIKNITLGYTISKSKLKFVGDLRLYVSVQNLYTFTNYKGVNPEITMNAFGAASNALNLGHDYGGYPVPRTIAFGVNLTL